MQPKAISSKERTSLAMFRNTYSFVLLIAVVLGRTEIRSRLWPFGFAVSSHDRPSYSSVDYENDSLCAKHGKTKKLYERIEPGKEPLLKGPETIVFGNDGTMFALTEEGFLVSITDIQPNGNDGVTLTGKSTLIADLGVGRPLGGRFTKDGTLYLADAHLGLTRIVPKQKHSKVELVASRVFDQGQWSQILYVNDVAIGPKTGSIYFTSSTEIAPDRIGTRTWDTMFMAKTDLIRGKKSGRLMKYNPETDEVSVLARDLFFANGIAVDKDETHIVFAETFTISLLKYNLKDDTLQHIVAGGLTGYPDGVDCAWKGVTSRESMSCFAVFPSAVTPLFRLVYSIPHPFDQLIRTLLLALPKSMAPPIKPYGSIVEVDPIKGGVVRYIQDPAGKDVSRLAGVTVYNNQLYLGSLTNDYIAIYDIE